MNKLKNDIETAIMDYPGLKLDDQGESLLLKGTIDLVDPDTSTLFETYSVELSWQVSL